jgi:hypothetical protein
MSGKMLALVVSTTASFVSVCEAQSVVFGPVQSPVNGHFYSVLSNSNWTDAKTASQLLGGSLATVRSAEEQTWINQTFDAYPFLWLGLYDPSQEVVAGQAHANNFQWVNGEAASYRNWGNGEPNNFNGEEYWTELVLTSSSTVASGTWNDIQNDANPIHPPNSYGPVYGLAEVVPEPASSAYLGLCAVPCLSRRCRRGSSVDGD